LFLYCIHLMMLTEAYAYVGHYDAMSVRMRAYPIIQSSNQIDFLGRD